MQHYSSACWSEGKTYFIRQSTLTPHVYLDLWPYRHISVWSGDHISMSLFGQKTILPLPGLTVAPHASHGLVVVRGVPAGVEEYETAGAHQVVETDVCCSPHHRMPFHSRYQGSYPLDDVAGNI